MGVDHHGVAVMREDLGVGKTIVYDAAVGLVADEVDFAPVFLFAVCQQLTQRRQQFPGIDHSRRIVRRIDDDGPGPFVDSAFDSFEVGLERLVSSDYDCSSTVIVDVVPVLHEVGR